MIVGSKGPSDHVLGGWVIVLPHPPLDRYKPSHWLIAWICRWCVALPPFLPLHVPGILDYSFSPGTFFIVLFTYQVLHSALLYCSIVWLIYIFRFAHGFLLDFVPGFLFIMFVKYRLILVLCHLCSGSLWHASFSGLQTSGSSCLRLSPTISFSASSSFPVHSDVHQMVWVSCHCPFLCSNVVYFSPRRWSFAYNKFIGLRRM